MTIADRAARTVSADGLAERMSGRGARDFSDGIGALIATGELPIGAQLPTIRDLARAAGVSPGTILAAWNTLRGRGLIETHRRGGSFVVDDGLGADADSARRGAVHPSHRPWSAIDLLQCTPDISLQPGLRTALLESLADDRLNVFDREYMTEPLRRAVEPTWPFAADAWATAGGGTEALLLAVAAAAQPGSTVAVHEPASPGLLDTLRELSLVPLAVAADDEGPIVSSLGDAIDAGAVAFVFQPGGEFARQGRVTAARVDALAETIRAAGRVIWIVEDDAIGPLADSASPSLGGALPDRTVRVRSYCKAYGIDVRTSVVGGCRELVERTIALRSHGVGSNSRILQNALAHLITSEPVAEAVATARATYAARSDALQSALTDRGVSVERAERGVVLWVGVADETDALVALARSGVSVAAGRKVFIDAQPEAMIRISPLQLPDDEAAVAELAELVAGAARGSAREFIG